MYEMKYSLSDGFLTAPTLFECWGMIILRATCRYLASSNLRLPYKLWLRGHRHELQWNSPSSLLIQKTKEFLAMRWASICLLQTVSATLPALIPANVSSRCLLKRLCSPVTISDRHRRRMKVWYYPSVLDWFFYWSGHANNTTPGRWVASGIGVNCLQFSVLWLYPCERNMLEQLFGISLLVLMG